MRILELRSPIVFDTDCISSFLWVKSVDMVLQAMSDCMLLIPSQVIAELGELMKFSNYRFVPQLMQHHISQGDFHELAMIAEGDIADE